jgi:hypothetical protein
MLLDDMLKSLKLFGNEMVIIGDEFGFEKREETIDNLLKNNIELNFSDLSLYTKNIKILYTVHWDSHFTILCSSKKTIETILNKFPFEGFFCTPETKIYWSLEK